MKTLKFGPYKQERQESYDIRKFCFIDHTFNGEEKKVYSNVNFSIFTDDVCNADCDFCVAQLRYENRQKMYSERAHNKLSDEAYFDKLEAAMEHIRPLNPTISLTGGEPTICSRLPRILELIEKYGFRKRTFTTNGSGLLKSLPGTDKPVIQLLIDAGFKHLNISKTHFNDDHNQSIMRFGGLAESCTNDMLREIVKVAQANDLRPRMSCVLLKSGIGTLDSMIEYMNFYQALGVDNIIFRELMDFNRSTMINESKVAFCDANKVPLKGIWAQIDQDPRFTPIRSLRGYYYYVEVYKYQSVDMVTEGANLVKLYDEKSKNPGIVYEMIFHPSGTLNGSWVETEDILLP